MSSLRYFLGEQKYLKHSILFLLTIFTTLLAGVGWSGHNPLELENLLYGVEYSMLLILFISAHEFGHFVAARLHGVSATLPYYIPFPGALLGVMPNFGTFGAVIKTRSQMTTRKIVFDVGVSGPLAGFIVCIIILAYGFMTLPGIEYIQQIHPDYPNAAVVKGNELIFGKTLLYTAFEMIFSHKGAFIPPMTEMYHYPMLCVGWFGLFVTSLNMIPIGQLDGGHITYAMFGEKVHKRIGITAAILFAAISIPDLFVSFAASDNFHIPDFMQQLIVPGGASWIFWLLMIIFFIRFRHPPVISHQPLDIKRLCIGYLSFIIMILSFTPSPLLVQ